MNSSQTLPISRQKNRISNKTIQYIIKSTLEKAGLQDRDLSTHKLRHTAATLMYQYGGVDVLINNAGVAQSKPFEEISMEEYDMIMNTNARA